LPSGDSAITVEFSRNIDDAANRRVLALDRALAAEPITGVTEAVPTYRSPAGALRSPAGRFRSSRREASGARTNGLSRRQQRPGDGAFPWSMAASMASTLDDVAKIPQQPRQTTSWRGTRQWHYRVAMIGFTPGWSYPQRAC